MDVQADDAAPSETGFFRANTVGYRATAFVGGQPVQVREGSIWHLVKRTESGLVLAPLNLPMKPGAATPDDRRIHVPYAERRFFSVW